MTGKGTAKYRVYGSYGKNEHVKFGFQKKEDALKMAKKMRTYAGLEWISVKEVNKRKK
jgi:hypothetical protein